MDEGVVKYRCEWIKADPPAQDTIADLMRWRQWCFQEGLIGEYPVERIGYGNISRRSENGFIISGTQTGHIQELGAEGYTEVIEADIEGNRLICRGPIPASSESLTHAMLYRLAPSIEGIIHIHNGEMWKALLNVIPTTSADIPYGTPEMAREIARLWREADLPEQKILAMAGHEDGIIAFGKDLDEAGEVIVTQRRRGGKDAEAD